MMELAGVVCPPDPGNQLGFHPQTPPEINGGLPPRRPLGAPGVPGLRDVRG